MKICSKCKQQLSELFFHKDLGSSDGLTYYCKTCNKQHVTEWRLKNKQKHNNGRSGIRLFKKNGRRLDIRFISKLPKWMLQKKD